MPDKDVKTIRDLIWYQYAKIIGKSALGPEAKQNDYGFIKKTFLDFKNSSKEWSDILREDRQFVQSERKCIYCGRAEGLQWEHIVPKTIRVNEHCSSCERVQGIHNQIWACGDCNEIKKQKGLYTFWHERNPDDRKFYDHIPPLLEKKYLKTIYYCHECHGTLEASDLNGDGKLNVFDLDRCIVF